MLISKQIDYDHMEEEKVEVKPAWIPAENKKYMEFMSEWKEMKLHIKSLFPNAVFKKVMTDKALFYPEKDEGELYVCRREAGAYKVEVKSNE